MLGNPLEADSLEMRRLFRTVNQIHETTTFEKREFNRVTSVENL